MAGNDDRRVRRTRRALREALIALIVERGYEKVTVQDVLDRADVGRSTFYAHYRDKDELFRACFDDLREQLERDLAATKDHGPHEPVRVLFDHAWRNQRVFRALCGRSGETAGTRMLHRLLHDALHEHLTPVGLTLPVDAVAEYHASGMTGVLVNWVRGGFASPPEEVARVCQAIATPSIMAALGRVRP